MQVLIVHCHPEPRSFNGALKEIARDFFLENSDQVEISDLYAEQFDPVERASHYVNPENAEIFSALAEQRNAYRTNSLPPEIVREIERLERSDLVIFQFPIWWHSVPAMLKGWMDRVFVSGGLYTSSMRYDRGYFKGRRALCSVTSGAPAESFEPGGRGGEIEQILWSTHFSLHYMGFEVLSPFATFGVQGHGFSYAGKEEFTAQMEAAKVQWRDRLASLNDAPSLIFPGWDAWDELGRPKP